MHEGHSHPHHAHDGGAPDKELALLEYMADHNRLHAAELKSLAHELEHIGMGEVSDLLDEAESCFTEGTDLLYAALGLLKESPERSGQ